MENNYVVLCNYKIDSVNEIHFHQFRNHPNVPTEHIANFYEFAQYLWRISELVRVANPDRPKGHGIHYIYDDSVEFNALCQITEEYRKVNAFQF